MKKIPLVLSIVLVVAILGAEFYYLQHIKKPTTSGANACPAIAKLCSDGSSVAPQGSDCAMAACPQEDQIQITQPFPNTGVTSPLTIQGKAKGNWFFEAVFPVKLYGANNQLLAQGQAQAQGNWMTTDLVPFTVTLNFTVLTSQTGTLVFHNDNPSGEPQNDHELDMPILLQP
jgi:hypothetical protein